MIQDLQHGMDLAPGRDVRARQEFVSSLRGYILNDMAMGMRQAYDSEVAPRFERDNGRLPKDGPEVHKAIKGTDAFRFYSSIRYNAQEMVWRSVIPVVERNLDMLVDFAKAKKSAQTAGGSLSLDPDLDIPRSVSAVDIHLAPGAYVAEFTADDVAQGAIYDNGLNIFAANLMGRNLDDIGMSMAHYVQAVYPDLAPSRILDCGCTIGHNSCAWKQTYPAAQVHAIDVGAPVLRYAHARAEDQGVAVHFSQADATALPFPDNHFDVVFSSMFLHELPLKHIRAYFREVHRVLKPGGLMLNMELPPNNEMAPYDSFYLDWDCYYNNEPYYKAFRDQDCRALSEAAGFASDAYIECIVPQYTYMDHDAFVAEVTGGGGAFNDNTGRLAAGIQWFAFGAWKSKND